MEIIIEATNGVDSQTRTLKPNITIPHALEKMQQMFEDDYLGLTYNLWVNGEIHTTLEL